MYEQVNAGPYKLFVTIRPPNVIPGVATIEVRSSGAAVSSIRITPTPLTGEASKHPPSSDAMKPSAEDPAFFTGSLWLMAPGSWQVHFDLEGPQGRPAAAFRCLRCRFPFCPCSAHWASCSHCSASCWWLGSWASLRLRLASRVSTLAWLRDPAARRRALVAGLITLAVTALIVYGGYKWWNVEATAYAADIYHPLSLSPQLSGNTLDLKIGSYDSDRQHASGRVPTTTCCPITAT